MTMQIDAVAVPKTYQTLLINSSDTTPIPLCAAVAGKTVRLWGLLITGGTTITFRQDTTAVSGALSVTGLFTSPPTAPRTLQTCEIPPYVQSLVGGTICLVPGAGGMAGIAYYTQD